MGVLERARAKVNEFISHDNLEAVEEVLYAMTLLHAGLDAGEYVAKYGLR